MWRAPSRLFLLEEETISSISSTNSTALDFQHTHTHTHTHTRTPPPPRPCTPTHTPSSSSRASRAASRPIPIMMLQLQQQLTATKTSSWPLGWRVGTSRRWIGPICGHTSRERYVCMSADVCMYVCIMKWECGCQILLARACCYMSVGCPYGWSRLLLGTE